MKMIRRIMVAIDFSDFSLMSLRYATDLAREAEAELLLVNVINKRDVDIMKKADEQLSGFSAEDHLRLTIENRKASFDDLLAQVSAENVPVTLHISAGVPYEELLKMIKEKEPNLLIMATKGRSNLMDTLVGSCARRLFRKSPIPVLSLPATQ